MIMTHIQNGCSVLKQINNHCNCDSRSTRGGSSQNGVLYLIFVIQFADILNFELITPSHYLMHETRNWTGFDMNAQILFSLCRCELDFKS
jgi:hypothetical protein